MNVFDSVQIHKPAANVFTLDHDVKSSYNFDKLYPFLCQPVYPGDTWNARAEVFMRAMPMLAPIMHNVDMRLYFFFVPMRLIWNENKKADWKVFITGGEDGMQSPDLPYFTYANLVSAGVHVMGNAMGPGSLMDHLGFPVATTTIENSGDNALSDTTKNIRICSLPFRAYQLVWNEYFRNQNVQNEVEFSMDEGEETAADLRNLFTIRYKNFEKDYFTSCLPFAQRGEAVKLPIDFEDAGVTGSVPVVVDDLHQTIGDTTNVANLRYYQDEFQPSSPLPSSLNKISIHGQADVSELSFTGYSIGTINDFRYCLRLQQWLENNARCGSRYIEQLLAHFGVTSSDARLQRPELLGGGKIPLLFTDVEQNSFGTGEDIDVLGNLGGKGTLYGKTNGFKKYFEEHGILLGLLTIIPRTSYSQGVSRVWTAFDKTDWYFPEFAHLGEQAVLNKELFFPVQHAAPYNNDYNAEPDGVFGYQGRFTELRYIPSSVHGELRTDLQYWHLGRLFPVQPDLNGDFVAASTRANIFAIEDIRESGYDPFVCQIHMDVSAVRPLPKYAIPTL